MQRDPAIFDIPATLAEAHERLNILATIDDEAEAARLEQEVSRLLDEISHYLRYALPVDPLGDHIIRGHKETVDELRKRLASTVERRKPGNSFSETKWITVTDAAKASGCTPAQISGAVRDNQLKSNGKHRKERRIDAADLTLWQLRRAVREGL